MSSPIKKRALSLSIVVPVFNEESRLPMTFSAFDDFLERQWVPDVEIIFVDDGSRDCTADIIRNKHFACPHRIISYADNRGKGAAVRTGMLEARGDYRLFIDADMSTPLTEVQKFIPEMRRGRPVIIGSRKMPGANVLKAQPWHRQKMGEVYTILANIITGVWTSDFTCGFKYFSREATEVIFSEAKIDGWSYDAEILFLAKKHGFPIYEVGVSWTNDEGTRVKLGKAAVESFVDLLRIRFRG